MIAYFVRRPLLVNLTIIFLVVSGFLSLTVLRRESFPNVNLQEARITTVFPGASPDDVEQLVTIPIEDELKEVEGLDQVRSISRHSMSEIDIRVDLESSNPEKVLQDARRAVDKVNKFPDLVTEKPAFVERKSSTFPVMEIGIFGNVSEKILQEGSEFVEKQLERVPGVSKVNIFGKRDREWWIELSPTRMRALSVTSADVIRAIAEKNVNMPAGSFASDFAVDLRTSGEIKSLRELKNLPLRSNDIGFSVKLSQIASFRDTYENPKYLARINGAPALTLTVIKKPSADIIRLTDRVKEQLILLEPQLTKGLSFQVINDESLRTSNRLAVVSSNAALGLSLVFIVLMVFLSFKDAILTSISLPLTLMATMSLFPIYDITFNLVSMLGIIVSLGMLVDNSIVLSENIFRYREKGLSPEDAAIKGASELVKPIIGTYLTTIAAFMPMMFMSGIMGKFIWQIPLLVILTLTASLLESFFLLPSRIARFGGKLNQKTESSGLIASLILWFRQASLIMVNHRYKSVLVILFFFIISMFFATKMPFVLFPKENSEQFLIKMEFNNQTKIQMTMDQLKIVEEVLQELPSEELVAYSLKSGTIQRNANDVLARFGEYLAMGHVFLTPQLERSRETVEIIADIEAQLKPQLSNLENISYEEIIPAPPIGAAITVAIEGPNYKKLKEISNSIQDYLKTLTGINNISDDYQTGRPELVLSVNDRVAAQTGITTAQVANVVRSVYEGLEVSTVRLNADEIPLRVKYAESYARDLNSLKNIEMVNRYGLATRLGSIISSEKKISAESLSHYDFERAITITADVDEKIITSGKANRLLLASFNNISKKYPGYQISLRGEQENTKKSMVSLARAGFVAFLAIFMIMAFIFDSLSKPLIIVLTIPLGFIGITTGFLLADKAMSFLAMIGVIGLAGVVVNASIVLVDFHSKLVKEGFEPYEALAEAAATRFRPIILTTITTMAGLFPTAYGIGGSDPTLIPMTLALAWGLASGTIGALLIIPPLLGIGMDIGRLFDNIKINITSKWIRLPFSRQKKT